METQDLIIKYAIGISKRYRRKEKNFFVNEMGKDFKNAGYEVKAVRGKHNRVEGINMVAGDLKKSDTIIIANYDTPAHIYGNPMKYYPFNGAASYSNALLPTWAPMIICMIVAIYITLIQVPKLDYETKLISSIFWVVALFVSLITPAFMIGGLGNKLNFNRNTSGCIAALKTAELLSDEQKKHVAFVLTDYGCTRHIGDYLIRNELGDSVDNKTVILLDCVGEGNMWGIGYKESSSALADRMEKCLDGSIIKHECPKEDLRYTSFSFYRKAILISRVKKYYDSYIVEHTACSQDINCKDKYIDDLAQAIVKFVK